MKPLIGGAGKRFAILRVGDGDEQAGAFLEGFAVEVHGAVFGHHPLDIGTGRNNPCARLELRHNLGAAIAGPGG